MLSVLQHSNSTYRACAVGRLRSLSETARKQGQHAPLTPAYNRLLAVYRNIECLLEEVGPTNTFNVAS